MHQVHNSASSHFLAVDTTSTTKNHAVRVAMPPSSREDGPATGAGPNNFMRANNAFDPFPIGALKQNFRAARV